MQINDRVLYNGKRVTILRMIYGHPHTYGGRLCTVETDDGIVHKNVPEHKLSELPSRVAFAYNGAAQVLELVK